MHELPREPELPRLRKLHRRCARHRARGPYRARTLALLAGTVLLGLGVWLLGEQAYLTVKAEVAGRFIDDALRAHLQDGQLHRPWRWADMHPVARLAVPRLGVIRPVLTGASGESMAFGLGHVDGTAQPNEEGNCVVAGHKDRALAFAKNLRVGDQLHVDSHGGRRYYVVTETLVVDDHDLRILEATEQAQLTLVTCYPFGGLLPSSLRHVTFCRGESGRGSTR